MSNATPSLLARLRSVRVTKSGCWSDAELLCHLIGDALGDLSFRLHQLGGRCYRNGVAAKAKRTEPPGEPRPKGGHERDRGLADGKLARRAEEGGAGDA